MPVDFLETDTLKLEDPGALGSENPLASDFETLDAPDDPWWTYGMSGAVMPGVGGEHDWSADALPKVPADGFGWVDDETFRPEESCCGACADGEDCAEGGEVRLDGSLDSTGIELVPDLIDRLYDQYLRGVGNVKVRRRPPAVRPWKGSDVWPKLVDNDFQAESDGVCVSSAEVDVYEAEILEYEYIDWCKDNKKKWFGDCYDRRCRFVAIDIYMHTCLFDVIVASLICQCVHWWRLRPTGAKHYVWQFGGPGRSIPAHEARKAEGDFGKGMPTSWRYVQGRASAGCKCLCYHPLAVPWYLRGKTGLNPPLMGKNKIPATFAPRGTLDGMDIWNFVVSTGGFVDEGGPLPSDMRGVR